MNPDLAPLMDAAHRALTVDPAQPYAGPLRVGVDLGTAYVVLVVLDVDGQPLGIALEPAGVVRDGVVVDFHGATEVVRRLKAQLEARLGRPLASAAACHPPDIGRGEVNATRYVLEAAGLECSALVEEPTAANAVLRVTDGAVVDVGGGTTGTAVITGGRVVHTADEATGGTHFSLVIAGALGIDVEDAEAKKTDPDEQAGLVGTVRPVMEKVATIVRGHIAGRSVDHIWLVGGTSAFPGMAEVVQAVSGIPATVPPRPLLITPLGTALHDPGSAPDNGEPLHIARRNHDG